MVSLDHRLSIQDKIPKHILLTGDGLPVATHRNVAPVEFENRIRGDGVVTNFGPIKSVSLTLEDAWVARTISEDAVINNYAKWNWYLFFLSLPAQFTFGIFYWNLVS